MCGICGYLTKKDFPEGRELLGKMGKALEHRGPDDEGFYEDDNIGLCHRRLSILDLSGKGRQPMKYGDHLILTYNGEIYNYIELRQELSQAGYVFETDTDTEIILAAYDKWGDDCLAHFNGMWAFALWDKQKNILFCARDRFGVKPFYYHRNEKRFLFASEIKGLLCDENIERVANPPIVYDYLTQGLLEHTNETFFKDIYKLPAGHYLKIDPSLNMEIKQFYDVVFSEEITGKLQEKEIQKFRDIFESSVRLRLRADVPVGSCLSGGLDSSSIVCCMDHLLKSEKTDMQQHTFSYCANDKRIDERKFMNAVTDETSALSHQVFSTAAELKQELEDLIYYQDEPFSSTGMYASYCVYRAAGQKGIKVLLDGQGADELLCGYRKSRIYYIKSLVKKKRPGRAVVEFWGALSQAKQSMFWKTDLLKIRKILSKKQPAGNTGFLSDIFLNSERGFDYSRRENFQHNDVFVVSLPALLRYADRNSMAFSVESRLPFLDYRFVEFCASLSLNKKIHRGWSKYIMRKALTMPQIIRRRRDKVGFATPEDNWLKKESEYFKSLFRDDHVQSKAYMNVQKLLREWDHTLYHNNSAGIFRYICLELWMRKFNVKSYLQEENS